MNKKVMALAVAGAFATPVTVLAQASNVQVFGTMYMEYAYVKQGSAVGGSGTNAGTDLVNIDILQAPGSEFGIKGEEALGGGTSIWFQCVTTADIRGVANGMCGRNSAVGLKGRFGGVYAGNWDMPTKRVGGIGRLGSDTGLWGTGFLLMNNSGSFNESNGQTAFSRRQNNSIFYDSPVFSGFQAFVGVSTTPSAQTKTTNASGAKPRVYSVAASYINGPLNLMAGYERHDNFGSGAGTAGIAAAGYAGTDTGWQIGGNYNFGLARIGFIYADQKLDTSTTAAVQSDLKVSSWQIGGDWTISGPHVVRGSYTKSNNTKGSFGGAIVSGLCTNAGLAATGAGQRIGNCGQGATGANIWTIEYVYLASKRTTMTAGYAQLSNDSNARYSLGAATQPLAGQNQSGFGLSVKNTF